VPHPLVAQPFLAVLLGFVPPQGPLLLCIPPCSAGFQACPPQDGQPSWVFFLRGSELQFTLRVEGFTLNNEGLRHFLSPLSSRLP